MTASAAVLAIDAGTTGITALVVGIDGRIHARGYREIPQHFPADGWVEHDLSETWSATLDAAREAIAAAPDQQVQAIGVTNQRETVCFWDRETLGAARRAIVWQDRRTAAMCEAMEAAGHGGRVAELTGLRLDPYFSATKIAWVRENDPHTWAQVQAGRVAIGTIDSYLVARMSRGLHHITDPTNASRTLLLDLRTGTWSAELCELFGVPMDALPQLVPSYGKLAMTDPAAFLGLSVPISGIVGDQQSALVGQAGLAAGAAKCTYGTGSFLLMHTGSSMPTPRGGLLATVALGHPDGRLDYALEGSIFVTGAAVQWLRDGLGIIDNAPQVEALARTVDDAGGVVFVPALAGLGAPEWDPHARGLIIGITRGTTAAHIARATLDAIAFQVADLVDLMHEGSTESIHVLRVDGGAAANDLLCQLQADAIGVPVDRSAVLETTGLGAAYLAGVGAGLIPFDAISYARASDRIFEPGVMAPTSRTAWHDAVRRARGWAAPANE